jgi:hypothetical protein
MILVIGAIVFAIDYLLEARRAEARYRITVNRRLEAITLS